jgi:hypothetical protein
MPDDARFGLQLFCFVELVPMFAGAVIGWWLHGRVTAYGWLGAFLPRIIRERLL